MPDTAPGTVFGPHPGSAHAHEQVVFGADDETGLRVIVGIYSTALGPALGGTRFYPYAGEAAALSDVLELSRAMAYKNALAGLDHGGGKAVIIGDPAVDKTEALLLAYGRFLDALGGRYVTACDVGTYVADMDVVARATRYATGRSPENGGAGDSSVLTAYGVFQGMRAGAEHLWGSPTLAGRTVGIAGVGKVGGTWSTTWSTTAPPSWSPTSRRPRSTPYAGCTRPSRRSTTPTRWCTPTWTSTRPARSATR